MAKAGLEDGTIRVASGAAAAASRTDEKAPVPPGCSGTPVPRETGGLGIFAAIDGSATLRGIEYEGTAVAQPIMGGRGQLAPPGVSTRRGVFPEGPPTGPHFQRRQVNRALHLDQDKRLFLVKHMDRD